MAVQWPFFLLSQSSRFVPDSKLVAYFRKVRKLLSVSAWLNSEFAHEKKPVTRIGDPADEHQMFPSLLSLRSRSTLGLGE